MKTTEHLIADATHARDFVLAGRARFTIRSCGTQRRFTFKVKKSTDGKVFYVSLLTRIFDNSYEFMGTINPQSRLYFHGRRAAIQEDELSTKAFKWVWERLNAGKMPTGIEFWHEGRCGTCSRPLTDPESILSGYGPECARKRLAA